MTRNSGRAARAGSAGGTAPKKICGFTIVELMVALTIGLIIMAAVIRLFATSRGTYQLEESLARVQESGRFAVEFLSQDIRMAGYAGCSANLSGSQVSNIVANPTSASQFNPEGISGYKYACTSSCSGALTEWDPDLPADYFSSGETPVTGTDVLVIQRGSSLSTHLAGNTSPSNANIQVLNSAALLSAISTGDILMVSDCKNADVFKITNLSSGGSDKTTVVHAVAGDGNTQPQMNHSYGNDAEIMKLVTRIYYVGRRGNNADNPPSLFRKELATNGSLETQELVEGVEVMRLSYGEDQGSDKVPDMYRDTPTAIANWRKVITVRAGLLVRTTENVEQSLDTKVYDLAGAFSAGPYNDKRRRRAFNSTVQIRNHF